jgi:hypothetical protein
MIGEAMESQPSSVNVLRLAAMAALLAGTLGSVYLTFYVGRQNSSGLLLTLFALWVVSPFVGAVLASAMSKRWQVSARVWLYVVMIVIALGSLAVYGEVAYGPPQPKPAFYFLMTPLASWVLIAITSGIGALGSGRRGT